MRRARAGLAALILLAASLGAAGCTEAIARSEPAVNQLDGPAPSIEQLAEAMAAWQENAVSMQMAIRTVATDADGEAVVDLEQRLLADLRTWEMYTVTDSGSIAGLEFDVEFHLLMRGDGIYMTPSPEAGWLRLGDWFDVGVLIEQIESSGLDADLMIDPRLEAEVERGALEGRGVWVARFSMPPELLEDPRFAQAAGAALGDLWDEEEFEVGIGRFAGDLTLVQYIDPLTGAPLRVETTMAVDDGGGVLRIAATADMIGWNAPFELPEPEPLLEEDEAEAVFDDWYEQGGDIRVES